MARKPTIQKSGEERAKALGEYLVREHNWRDVSKAPWVNTYETPDGRLFVLDDALCDLLMLMFKAGYKSCRDEASLHT